MTNKHIKKIILTIIILLAAYNICSAKEVNLEQAFKVRLENKKVLYLNLINNSRSRKSEKQYYDKKVNGNLFNLISKIKNITLLNKKAHTKLLKKIEDNKKKPEEEQKYIQPVDITITGKYKYIHQTYKDKLGEDEGDQFLTRKERYFFTFEIYIIDTKTNKIIHTIKKSSYNKNYYRALKNIATEIKPYLKQNKKYTYYYPIDINFGAAAFVPVKNFDYISSIGAGITAQVNVQNLLFAKSVFGLSLDFYYVDDNSTKINNYLFYNFNLISGYRFIFTNDYYLAPQIGLGYICHHINSSLYFDPVFSMQLEFAAKYIDKYYLYITPAYNLFKEKDQTGRFISFKIGLKYFIN